MSDTEAPNWEALVEDTNVLTSATNCYPNQLKDAGRIYRHYRDGSHYATFIAPMQSGKTGTYLELVAQMFRDKKVEKIYIICGCSEKELCDQLKEDIQACINNVTDADIVAALRASRNTEEMLKQQDLKAQVSQQVEIIWSDDLKSGKGDLTEVEQCQTKLIIWDESHYAEKHNNLPALWWKRNGIYNLLHATPAAIAADPVLNSTYLLTVSATPSAQLFNDKERPPVPESPTQHTSDSDAEASDNTNTRAELSPEELRHFREATQHHPKVEYTPSEAYIGVSSYLANQQVGEAPPIGSPQFRERFVDPFIHQRKWLVVRVSGNTKSKVAAYNHLERVVAEAGLGHLRYYDRSSNANFELRDFEQPPVRTTIVVIDGLLRMGHVLPKKHVGAVMETAATPNATTILQGLLGRMCGYPEEGDDWSNKMIFVPRNVIPEIKIYAQNLQAIVSSTTMKSQVSREEILKYHPMVPFVLTPKVLNELDLSSADDNEDKECALGDIILELANSGSSTSAFEVLLPQVARAIIKKSDQWMVQQRDNAQTFLQQVRTYYKDVTTQGCEHITNPATRVFQKDSYPKDFPRLWNSVDKPTEHLTMPNNWYFRTDKDKPPYPLVTPYPFVMGVVYPDFVRLDDGLEPGSIIIHGCTDIGTAFKVPPGIIGAESKTGAEVWNLDGQGHDTTGGGGGSSGRGTKRSRDTEDDVELEGGLTIELSPETRVNPVKMKAELRDMIDTVADKGRPQYIKNIVFHKESFQWANWRKTSIIRTIFDELRQDKRVQLIVFKDNLQGITAYDVLRSNQRRKHTMNWKKGVTADPVTEKRVLAIKVIPCVSPTVPPVPDVPPSGGQSQVDTTVEPMQLS